MKKILVRILLLMVYMSAAWINLALLPASFDLWNVLLAAIFACATTFLSGNARFFIFGSVFVVSCAAPVAALATFSRSLHTSWIESCWNTILIVVTENPFHGLELVFPSLAAVVAVMLAEFWLKRRTASKP